jgi:hypothetical protein
MDVTRMCSRGNKPIRKKWFSRKPISFLEERNGFFRKLRDKPFYMKQEVSPPTDYIAK